MNRGERRRRTENKRRNARKALRSMDCDLPIKTVKMFNNMKQCSCHMCCNVRRSNAPKRERLTRSELRQIEDLNSYHKCGE